MELLLKRTTKTDKSTIGELFVDGKFECYTLEDVEREVKIKGETAISKGVYGVEITMSSRFKKMLPLLINVPNFEGVRIHPGNTAKDTEGCILVGMSKDVNAVWNSKLAFQKLFEKMKVAESITLTIE